MRKLQIANGVLLVAIVVAALLFAAPASADHPLSQDKATTAFQRYIEKNFGGEWVSGPTCTRTGTYSFTCRGTADFPDGSTRDACGDVVANGPKHHTIRVINVRECSEYDLPSAGRWERINRLDRIERVVQR